MLTHPHKETKPLTTLIHPTAVIHPLAQVHPSVQVGPYAVIGENVSIGAETKLGPHVVIEPFTDIGQHNEIYAGAVIGGTPQDLKYKGDASWVKIGDYNTIREYVTINRATAEGEETVIGNHNLLMAYSHVAHNCVIENEVIIANSVALAGHIHIESKARISGVLGVHQFVHIGRLAMVGGMSRIERDVPPFTIVEGNPSRVRSLNLVGLKRSGLTSEEINLIKKAFRLVYRSNIPMKEGLEQLELLSDHPHVQHFRHFLQRSTTEDGRRGLIRGKQ
ncbi:MAG: acyl-ACP--UDP-N-acetylglucosamine O-acyltransferase [Microcystaceae cyanobacterium]